MGSFLEVANRFITLRVAAEASPGGPERTCQEESGPVGGRLGSVQLDAGWTAPLHLLPLSWNPRDLARGAASSLGGPAPARYSPPRHSMQMRWCALR